jgi:hypothetical protein
LRGEGDGRINVRKKKKYYLDYSKLPLLRRINFI